MWTNGAKDFLQIYLKILFVGQQIYTVHIGWILVSSYALEVKRESWPQTSVVFKNSVFVSSLGSTTEKKNLMETEKLKIQNKCNPWDGGRTTHTPQGLFRLLPFHRTHSYSRYFPTNMSFHTVTCENTFLQAQAATTANEEHFFLFPRPITAGLRCISWAAVFSPTPELKK